MGMINKCDLMHNAKQNEEDQTQNARAQRDIWPNIKHNKSKKSQ